MSAAAIPVKTPTQPAHVSVGTRTDLGEIETFVIVSSRRGDCVNVRLQSDPIVRGLQNLGGVRAWIHAPSPEHRLVIDRASCILFHWHDLEAIRATRAMERRSDKILIICLGSDIYSYSSYTDVHDLVDFYIMPTDLHRRILASQVYKPVYTLPECIDPIALEDDSDSDVAEEESRGEFPIKHGKRMIWFGYPESFEKGMSSLMPVIQNSLNNRTIDGFELMLDESNFQNRFALRTIPYHNTTFRKDVQPFDYAILSHFALDLKINSYIKSANKAVTSLMAGLIPIASDTPNYREFFQRYGLERFLFSSATELDALLRNLDPVADSRAIKESNVITLLRSDYSEERLFASFLAILKQHRGRTDGLDLITLVPCTMADTPTPPPRPIGFRHHLSDLIPSAVRGLKSRLRSLVTHRPFGRRP